MKRESLKTMALAVVLLLATLTPAVATTYKLVKVTSVKAGKLYVFEQSGKVMNNSISSGKLETVSFPSSTSLTGSETYIWTLEGSGSVFKMKNIKENNYLQYNSSGTALAWANQTYGSSWTFTHVEENNKDYFKITLDNSRYLGYSSTTDYSYKCYSLSSTDEHPYCINVYQLVECEDVTVTTAGMATYASNQALDFSGVEGLKAYKAKVSGNEITFTSVGLVPAGEGVLLKATTTLEANTVFSVPYATTSVAAWAAGDNDFVRGTGGTVPSESEGYYNYILNNKGGVIGFYKANNQVVATNRAYLSTTSAPPTSAGLMDLSFEEGTTGVGTMPIDNGQWTIDN